MKRYLTRRMFFFPLIILFAGSYFLYANPFVPFAFWKTSPPQEILGPICTDGQINATALSADEQKLYIGGTFTQVGRCTGGGIPINSGGTLAVSDYAAFPKVAGIVNAVAPDGAGGWYIGGQFNAVGNQRRVNLARINGDGSLHSWKSEYELNGTVSALAFDEASTLYLGGSFTGFGLLNGTSYGAPLDPTTGAVSNLGASLINNVIKASIPDGSGGWYIGGSFTTVGGVTAPGVAHLASDGTYLSNLNLGSITGAVSALKLVGTTLYIGGAFRWLFLALVTEYLASY